MTEDRQVEDNLDILRFISHISRRRNDDQTNVQALASAGFLVGTPAEALPVLLPAGNTSGKVQT